MYKELTINNFRGFENFELNDLERVNLIAGKNNIGKTALLESIFLLSGSSNPQLALRIDEFRGIEQKTFEFGNSVSGPYDNIFYNFDNTKTIQFRSLDSSKNKRSLKIKFNPKKSNLEIKNEKSSRNKNSSINSTLFNTAETGIFPTLDFEETQNNKSQHFQLRIKTNGIEINLPPKINFPTFFLPSHKLSNSKEDAKLLGEIDLNDHKQIKKIVNILKIIENRIERISLIPKGDEVLIYGSIGLNRSIPLQLMGEGLSRLTSILLRIANARNGILIIDEIENGFHHSILEDIWLVIKEAAREFNVQLFITTHSYECILSAHKVFFNDNTYDFGLFRLAKNNSEIVAKKFDKEKLDLALNSNFEVR